MIRAIVTDLDDTLLRYDKTISEFTIQTLKRCRAKGVKVLFASGRGMSAKDLIPFELFNGYIMMNGAIAVADDNMIYQKMIEPKIFIPFLKKMSESNILAAAEINGVHFSNFDVSTKWQRDFIITDFESLEEDSEKLYTVVDTPEQAEIVRRCLPPELYAHFTKDNLALITHHEAKKINALLAVLAFWNISLDDTVAFGDDVNDRDMLESCGIGVVMDNALAEIKEIGDEICCDCDNDGVAKWLSERVV